MTINTQLVPVNVEWNKTSANRYQVSCWVYQAALVRRRVVIISVLMCALAVRCAAETDDVCMQICVLVVTWAWWASETSADIAAPPIRWSTVINSDND